MNISITNKKIDFVMKLYLDDIEDALRLKNGFSISIDDVMSSMFDSAMKFPREDERDERRTIEFSPEDFVDKLNRSKSRLDGSAMEDLKNIFLDIEKFKESDDDEEDTNKE